MPPASRYAPHVPPPRCIPPNHHYHQYRYKACTNIALARIYTTTMHTYSSNTTVPPPPIKHYHHCAPIAPPPILAILTPSTLHHHPCRLDKYYLDPH